MTGKRGRPRKERYARLMGGYWRNEKVRRLSLEARGLLVTAWSYAADNATDGRVPLELVRAWSGSRYARLMKELGAFLSVPPGSIDAIAHDWTQHNISAEEWEQHLEAENERKSKRKREHFPAGKSPGKVEDIPPGNDPHFRGRALDDDEDEDDHHDREAGSRAAAAREREQRLARSLQTLRVGWSERHLARLAAPAPPLHLEALKPLASWIVEYLDTHDSTPESVGEALLAGFWSRTDLERPKPEWLVEDPLRYVTGVDAAASKRSARRRSDRLPPGTGAGFDDGEFPSDDDGPRKVVSYG